MKPIYEPDLNETEQCLLEVINEPRFSALEKTCLVIRYAPLISVVGELFLFERIRLIEDLKSILN